MKKSPELTKKILALLPEEGFGADVGCGEGELCLALAGSGVKLAGVEPAPEREGVLAGRAEALPLEDESADVLVYQCVFSLCEPGKSVSEMRRVLKDGGRVILADLFSGDAAGKAVRSPLLGRIDTKETLEAYFAEGFSRTHFSDETPALLGLMAQSILDGEDGCVAPEDREMLRRVRARYGLWVWTKNGSC